MDAVFLISVLCCLVQATQGQFIQFVQSPYYPIVPEEQPVNSTVLVVSAVAQDSFGVPLSGVFSFTASPDDDSRFFSIEDAGQDLAGTSSANIRNAVVFDWDTENAQIEFSFSVTFTTVNGDSRSAQVLINIADVNDNAPRFVKEVFDVRVFEELMGGAFVVNATAIDPDQSLQEVVVVDRGNNVQVTETVYVVENGRIRYEILAGNELGHFRIDPDDLNGTITISPGVQLDVDLVDFYNLTVMATDGGGLNDSAAVFITVLDSNDNPPHILGPQGVDVTIPEDTAPGYVIVEAINATDADLSDNAVVQFLITDGSQRESFDIDEETGQITVSRPLDREVQSMLNLTVAARDFGFPTPLQDVIFVVVRLLDVNDYVPQFSELSYTFSVLENTAVGRSIAQVVAQDLDEGPNATVTYSILEGANEGEFYIDPLSGDIFTNTSLDREVLSIYNLTIEAADNPLNTSYQLSAEVNVTILVEDSNDNIPMFSQEAYTINILDNVTNSEPLLQVTATDRDSGSNGLVTYRFQELDSTSPQAFRIDENTGTIFRNRRLSFESQSVFMYSIRALDGGSVRRSQTVPLTIVLYNVNENPPLFDQLAYNTTVIETTPIGTEVLNVSASDRDEGDTGEVMYRIVTEFDEAGAFGVNETSGTIVVTSSLDFDTRGSIFFVVEAYDGGFPKPFTDRTNVTIFLTGTNDEPPSIDFPEGFQLLVPENTPPEVDVVTLRDFTADPEGGDAFSFFLQDIYDPLSLNDSFSLNESTGLVRSLRTFDRESQPEGVVIAVGTADVDDNTLVTNITVMIKDMNDNAPIFMANESTTTHEFLPIGTTVFEGFIAMDADIGSNADLRYDLYAGEGRSMFTIDPVTGTLSTAGVLNKTIQDVYNLTVIAMDQGTPQLFGFGEIVVEILDSNDMFPIFSESIYAAAFSEADPVGTSFFRVNATDGDVGTNAELRYFFANGSDSEGFTLDAITGELFTDQVFDRENVSSVELTVTAVDSGLVPRPLTGSATVMVTIEDYNDHPPLFNESLYEADVVENAENGTFVAIALATDEDADAPNNVVQYSLLGNRSDIFAIDPVVGVVTVAGEVDWEEGETFSITIAATDSAAANAMFDTVQLLVTILDVNDRPPVFVPATLDLSIPENTLVVDGGVEVGVVMAEDADSPGNNSLVTFSILMDFANGKFTLDPVSGLVLFIRGTLDRERRSSYDLLIRATDSGRPTLHTDATLNITLVDTNDFDPVFDPTLYSASVPEDTPIGMSVVALLATDADSGSNADLRYSIDDLIMMDVFAVNETTGFIFVSDSLDFEDLTSYSFDVTVSDSSEESIRNDTAHVDIIITDSNDHSPVFDQSEYSAVIRENLASGTVLLRVSAGDGDTDTAHTDIEYTLSISEGSGNFGVDPETGVVYTTSPLDREEFATYDLTIVANNSLSQDPLDSLVHVYVNVSDLNDMHPTFDLVVEVDVFENFSINSTIYTLIADDGDEGVNGTVMYTLLQPSDFFQLNSSTGDLILIQPLDYEVLPNQHILPVMATDSGDPSFSNYTNVLVHVLDSNETPPTFASQLYTVTVDSEADVGTAVLMLVVSDTDQSNAVQTLSIISGNELGLFAVDDDGIVLTTASLQLQVGESFVLSVQVSDSELNSTAIVTLHVQSGASILLPFFDSRTYSASLSELAQDGDLVMDFSGVTQNGVSFGTSSDAFTMSTSGSLTVADSSLLDFETRPLHQVTVSVENSDGDRAFAVLNVQLLDENEHAPQFIADIFLVGIPETVPMGVAFFTAIASDDDGATPNDVITYDIQLTEPSTLSRFSIDSQTGELRLLVELSYEVDGDRAFNVTVRATNSQATPTMSSEARVEILILNGNSFDPVFDVNLHTLRLLEDFPVGSVLLNISATDDDQGSQGEITYGIFGDHRYLDFEIDTFTGQLTLSHALDYERQVSYTLNVMAWDGGNPARSSVVPVEVFVIDLNDNSPVWDQEVYLASVVENATIGSSVVRVRATDRDQIVISTESNGFGYVTYSITQGDPMGYFNIDPDTGVVSVMSSLDRESYPEYNLTLNATDEGGLFANAYLVVTVHDSNDQVPYFVEDPYMVDVSEDAMVGTPVATVAAVDTDLNRNSEILYLFADSSMDGFDSSGTFSLNSTTGELVLEMPIDRENLATYAFTILAVDRGNPPLTGSTQVLVHLLDINEFPPEFDALFGFFGEVFENEPPGVAILQINSTDEDFGENGTVLYTFDSGDTNLFDIAADTGVISVAGPLDFESVDEYELVVMATDAGPFTERLVSFANVTIAILDRNDNDPVFSQDPYIASISEDFVSGDLVLNVNSSDADSGTNAEVFFDVDFMLDEEARENFVIDETTGAITLSSTSNLDRERTQRYDIVITVTDKGSPPLSSDVDVIIDVVDVNDNTPLFTLSHFQASISENLPTSTSVTSVFATDADTGKNSEVRYSITDAREEGEDCLSVDDTFECLESLDSVSFNLSELPFVVDVMTGEVSLSLPLDREMVSVYVLEVEATDSGSPQLANTTFVVVEVLDQNDEVPMFTRSVYYANISEYSVSGELVTMVLAEDADLATNAEISYSLIDSTSSFVVDMVTGSVVAAASDGYDRETRDVYNLTVMATDGGAPSLTSTALVVVTITDENDSPPIFTESSYTVSIGENLPPGTVVVELNATDADIGTNAALTFSIQSSFPSSHFAVDPSTGILSTTQQLDREAIDIYTLVLQATDGGNPPLNGTAELEVVVIDSNDLPPNFINASYEVYVDENLFSNQSILGVLADDADVGVNADVSYSIVGVVPDADAFEIDPDTGDLFLRSSLDAEVSLSYNVTVRASNDLATPIQLSEITVSVLVGDINDNTPIFGQLDYNIPFLESNPPGSVVVNITAIDMDATNQNSELSFEITGGYNTSLFVIDTVNGVGVVSVAGILDRETEPVHVIEITVFDNGLPQLDVTTTLTVVLQDFNDNSPVFEQTSYFFSLPENLPVATLIGQIRANDVDQQNVTYHLNDTELFQIDSVSGEIFSAVEFDREEQTLHTIIAVATDSGGRGMERSTEVLVNISILDVNDETPTFTTLTYYIHLLENTSINSTSISSVQAVDTDNEDNAIFSYSILSGNDSSSFSVDSLSGELYLELALDRELQDVLRFVVAAADSGEPSLTGTAEVVVMVLDNNDNTPAFNSSLYTASLDEDTPPGTTVLYVGASDLDIDENANITFSLVGGFLDTFSIGGTDGVISLIADLDYENIQEYAFQVVAQDGGVRSLSSSSDVVIEVLDLNDNSPLFDSDVYQVSIPENAILGAPIFQVPATDRDSTSNGELRYTILTGNLRSVFSVDEVFGVISLADNLDREITPSYSLEVRVVDSGLPQFTASATLEVTVSDVNDHIPKFGSNMYSVLIQESHPIGTSVFTFEAIDLDIGTNADLSYSIVAGGENGTFEIGSSSGELTVACQLDTETQPSYSLTILVSDNGSPDPLVDTTTIRVTVGDVNEYPPTFPLAIYYINISQNTVVGHPIGHFVATDDDRTSMGGLRYRLVDGMVHFEADAVGGVVYVNSPLTPGVFILSLEVTDGFFTTSIDVHVVVVPFLEELTTPLFAPPTYLFDVPESAQFGDVVGMVMPSSVMLIASSGQDLFDIDSSGRVVVMGTLDRETAPVHVLNIVTPSTPPTYAVMTINILDVNDNAPTFESSEYQIFVLESLPLGSSLLDLRPFDLDEPVTINSEFRMFLSDLGNEHGYFDLDPLTGVLSLSAMLDYENSTSHVLTAIVTNDMATPTLSSSTLITISLLDENDNSPQFSEMFYRISIPELTPVGTEILTLEASDADSGTNSELVFSITHLSEPLTFVINQTSGVLATNETFMFDFVTSFVISVEVADRGNPQPRGASTTVFVEVVPDNISPPLFSDPDGYSVEVPETLDIGGAVITVSAFDLLEMDSVVYSLESGGSDGIFDIDPSTGLVTLLDTLDFKAQPFHRLVVVATDSGTPPTTTSVELNITVLDVNNHAPVFEQRSYQVSVFENVTVGTQIIQVVATDADVDTSNITYQITVNYRPQGVPAFSIDEFTGVIVTTTPIDREEDDVIQLLVSAIDSGYVLRRSTTIPVIVELLDLNDSPPVFVQSEFSAGVLRLLSAGKPVTQVIAVDPDSAAVGEELMYSIVNDDSGGLFSINPASGWIDTTGRVPEETRGYLLNVSAFDGVFLASVLVNLLPVDNGEFCEDGGFCTSVREVNCTFDIPPFVICEPFCVLPYSLSPEERVCLEYSCVDSALIPCIATETCQPANVPCNGVCPLPDMSVCPTTGLCHMTTLTESCDSSNVTCLIGQSLVQRSDSTRYCTATDNLPPTAASCTSDDVYCEGLGQCMNRSTPYLCQACPGVLVPCPASDECVPDLIQCCGPDEEFCSTLSSCLLIGTRCELPNIAPSVTSNLIVLDSLRTFDEEDVYADSNGYTISVFLGDPGLDSQGEELSIAIVGASDLALVEGEWQFAVNSSASWQTLPAGEVSESNALLLPSTARLRFVRGSIVFDGAVWLRIKTWDGNDNNGFISSRQDLVRDTHPGFSSTLPYSPDGAFSLNTTLLTVLVHPLVSPPSFDTQANLLFSTIEEDVAFSGNFGNSLSELVVGVVIDDFVVLRDAIEGFPQDLPYEQLLPAEVRGRYYDDILRVNPTRVERMQAFQSGQSPGVAAMLDLTASNQSGTWQVALGNDPKQFRDLATILTSGGGDIALLNVSTGLRFLPSPDFCGTATILLAPWDGYWISSVATQLEENGYVVLLEDGAGLSGYNLDNFVPAEVLVECVPDSPLVLESAVQLSPIPYRIAYRYERLFTLLVDSEISSLRGNGDLLSSYLQIIFQYPVTLERFSPALQQRTQVSFSIEGDSLTFEDISLLINMRMDTLSMLGFNILDVTQDASYGPGAGCPGDTPSRYHGDHVNTLVSTFASDAEGDYLGMAVVRAPPTSDGTWQYHRGNWSARDDSQYNQDTNVWLNFPSTISETAAFLLHGSDRIRFIPHPDSLLTNGGPSIVVKVWDDSMGELNGLSSAPSEVSLMANTDPLVDTIQSLYRLIGLFSTDVVTVTAARYGCDGNLGSGLAHDQCCVCGGNGESCVGCDGERGSNVGQDSCDSCGGASSCLGCDGIPFSGTELGQCQVCLSQISIPTSELAVVTVSQFPPSSFTDCRGECHGNALLDNCNVCSGGGTSHDFDSDQDCEGVCFGNATIDTCGDCVQPSQFDQNLDCTGVCYGSFLSDSCGVCQLPGEGGEVRENRDCSGECYGTAMEDSCGVCHGGSTGVSLDSTQDVCGVCDGDNTTCIGCDGGVASGRSIDGCGQCDGNDCGCFVLNSVSPDRGPVSGGTRVVLEGAGFFLNDTTALGFQYNTDLPNCGAPMRFPNGSAVRVVCQFTFIQDNEVLRFPGEIVNQSTVACSSQVSVASGIFSVQLSINGGSFSNSVQYTYDDYSTLSLEVMTPVQWELNSEPTVAFLGEGFVDSTFSTCLLYNAHTCSSPPSSPPPSGYESYPAIFVSSSEVRCVLPSASAPCRVRVRLSFDGQESGRVESESTDFTFTYRSIAPQVVSARFREDLSGLSILFDRSAETTDSPSCTDIFNEETLDLIGGSLAMCFWGNSRQDSLSIVLPAIGEVRVGSSLTFNNGVIQMRDTLYSFSITDLTVRVDSDSIQPIAVIDGPNSIPFCGEVSFSGLHSLYPGYSGFEFYWSILVQESTISGFSLISQYVDTLDRYASAISLDSTHFLEGVAYSVQLHVVNSAGVASETATLQLVKDSEPTLEVVLLGAAERSVRFDEVLVVDSVATGAECRGQGTLQFHWEVLRIVDERRNVTISEDISTVKRDSRQITIPAFFLQENTRYDVNLVVTSVGPSYMARASLRVSVLPSPLTVRIHGGNRVLSAGNEVVLDARNSTYSSALSVPTFTWICTVVGSLDACYNKTASATASDEMATASDEMATASDEMATASDEMATASDEMATASDDMAMDTALFSDDTAAMPVPISLPRTSFISFSASTLNPGQSYSFTLRMEQEGAVVEGTVVIEVVGVSSLPMVEVSPPTSDLLLSEEVTLVGYVFSVDPLQNIQWSSVQRDGFGDVDLSSPGVVQSQVTYDSSEPPPNLGGSDFSVNPVMATVSSGVINRVNLILSPQILDPTLSYVFRLTAASIAGSSYAELVIEADATPISATLSPSPGSGVAMETEFRLAVSGALDSISDSPFLYQFGVIMEETQGLPLDIQWLSGIQTSPFLLTVLPSGNKLQSFSLNVLARVFDRKGGYSDVTSAVTVLENPSVSNGFYSNRLEQLQTDLATSKDWSRVVSKLVAYLTEMNRNTSSLSQDLKESSLEVFLDVFDNYLPPSQPNYLMAASVLAIITENQGILDTSSQVEVSGRLRTIAEWFKMETTIESSFLTVPTRDSGQPLFLQSGYPVPEKEPISPQNAAALLLPWVNILESSTGTSSTEVARMFVEGTEVVSNILCQQSSTGEQPSLVSTPLVELYATISPPLGRFSLSGHLVDFGSSVSDIYQSHACPGGVACSESCVSTLTFSSDFSLETQNSEVSKQVLTLSADTRQKIVNEIEGSAPQEVELVSEVLSLSVSIPSQDTYLVVQDLESPIEILIPVPRPLPSIDSVPLCLYREVGGASGYGDYEWLLDDTTPPTTIQVDSVEYYVCLFDHLTEFAVGLLPPPVITDPPTTSPPATTTTPTTMATTPMTVTTPTIATESVGSPVGAIVAVIIVLILVGVGVGVVILIVCLWKKKKRNMKILPDESANEGKPEAELLQTGPLTPAESKIPMDIIQCLEEGKRTKLGKMNVLPSIRLRELRSEVAEHFPSLKNKPFYFLTRQLCDIDPTTEQQQFVSIVFGEKPIFIREVAADNLQTKRHFCVCGNAAQFECSNCSSQGYCSEECQHSHWMEKHRKECSRLSERRRRSDVLYNRQNQNTPAPFSSPLSPISEAPLRSPMGLPGAFPAASATSPTATSPTTTTPANWKSFMSQKRVAPPPPRARALSMPARNVTTLGSLAKQGSFTQEPSQPLSPLQGPSSTTHPLGPLKRLTLPASGIGQQQLQLQQQQQQQQQQIQERPSFSRMTTASGGLTPLSPNHYIPSPQRPSLVQQSPLQPPSQQNTFFSRPQPRGFPPPPNPARQLSITSVGSADFATSPRGTGVRAEPLLEYDEEGYASTDTSSHSSSSDSDVGGGGAMKQSGGSSISRPPSLAVRKKDSRMAESESSESSESEEEEEEEEDRSFLVQQGEPPNN